MFPENARGNLSMANHIIEHWIEDEQQHIVEYEEWAKRISGGEGDSRKTAAILQAAGKLHDAVGILATLLEK